MWWLEGFRVWPRGLFYRAEECGAKGLAMGFSPNTIRFFPGRTRVGLIGWTKSLSLRIFLHANNPPMVNIPSPITRNATTSVGDSFVLKKFIISLLLLELLVLEFCGDVLVVEAMVLSSHGARLSVR